jgi:signal transduction histidine kinase
MSIAKESFSGQLEPGGAQAQAAARVLLIEPDPSQAGNLSNALLASGYDVAIAETPEAGVEMACSYHPDAILLSQHGPQIGAGIELCVRLKTTPGLAEVPLLVVDDDGAKHYGERALEAGIEEFIPVTEGADGALIRLKHALHKRRLAEQLKAELSAAGRERELLHETKESLLRSYEQAQKRLTELEEANEKLRELDKLKAGFINTIVHDIRSPLTVILGTLDLLREEVAEGRQIDFRHYQQLFDESLKNCQEIARLVDDMLALAQMRERRLTLNFEPTAVTELVAEAMQVAAGAARRAGIRLTQTAQPSLPIVYVDRKQIHRALMNLVNNAIKFTPSGGEVSIRARFLEEKRRDALCDYVLLSVVDTGEGLSPQESPYVFDAYWQASNGKHKVGTGLGLAIVKRIAVAHGGNVSVRSRLGKGSTFTIMIPVRESAPTQVVELTE